MPKQPTAGGDGNGYESDEPIIDEANDIEDNDETKSVKSEESVSEPEETTEIKDDDEPAVDETSEIKFETDEPETCLYKISSKIKKKQFDTEESDDDLFEEEITETHTYIVVKPEDRITKPILTKYERVRILGDRRKQLTLGAKPMLKGVENLSPKEISNLELKYGVIPFIIVRNLPSGLQEHWKVNELKIMN